MDPDALSWTVTGALRHRWSLPYQRASEEGLKSELELRLESLCGWRRMRAAAPADPRISVRQVTLLGQLVYRAQRSGRPKNCRRSCRTRRERPRPVGAIAMILFVASRQSLNCFLLRWGVLPKKGGAPALRGAPTEFISTQKRRRVICREQAGSPSARFSLQNHL